MSPETTTLAERYALESTIASGGMATVWRARDGVLARPIAVKILHPHLSADEAFVARFRREALAAARLAHPNIVSIYDTGSEKQADGNNRHYIVMEFCGGGTLADVLKEAGQMDPERVVAVGTRICEALAYAHRNGVVHRDIKPPNVLLADHGEVKVGDFGIAKAAFAASDITATGAILGTVTYLSPEQVKGEEPDERSDLYSVGILLHELITGRPPFAEETQIATAMAHARTPPPPVRTIRAGVPKQLEAVVLKALAKKPQERFATADDMRHALEGAVVGGSSTAVLRAPVEPPPAPPEPRHGPRPRRSLGWLFPVILVLGAVIAAALILPRVLSNDDGGDLIEGPSGGGGAAVQVSEATDFDPEGDGQEHPTETARAFDGDDSTSWSTEDYSTALSAQKPGVGLVFDLGEAAEIASVEVSSDKPGYSFELMQASEPGETENDFETVRSVDSASNTETIELDDPITARYWLVWITDLPEGGPGSANISEVSFFSP